LAASATLTITPLSANLRRKLPVRKCMAYTINGLHKAEVITRLGPCTIMASVEWERLKWAACFSPSIARQVMLASLCKQNCGFM
jgi:hypothetical protein